jgi:succinyl-CoA:acetate CoA-transferase
VADERIRSRAIAAKVMSADEAAALIPAGATIGMSGFTGAGYPKQVPGALARRIAQASTRGERFTVSVWTGASTAPELDGALASVDGIDLRMPYQSDPVSRAKINSGVMDYLDLHLSHVAQMVWEGFFGHLDLALLEVAGVTEDGKLIPSSSVGNNKTWLDLADRVILEVNSWQPEGLEGMHDIYYGTALPPHRRPVPIVHPADRIGIPYLLCPPEKIAAVVPTHAPDRNAPFRPGGEDAGMIAGHLLDFLAHEVRRGRLPRPSAAAVWRRERRERGTRRAGRWAIPAADRLYRGDPGRDAAVAALGHTGRRLGNRVLAQPGRHGRTDRQPRCLP